MLVALIVIEAADFIFAADCIPTILSVTQDTFIAYSSNIVAILGLRALYFALAETLYRYEYLKYSLALILLFIGCKIILNGIYPQLISTTSAFFAILSILLCGIFYSLYKTNDQVIYKEHNSHDH